MELPTSVLVHNEILGIKGNVGMLLNVSDLGYYEVNLKFGTNVHRVLLPVASTVIIAGEPEERGDAGIEIER